MSKAKLVMALLSGLALPFATLGANSDADKSSTPAGSDKPSSRSGQEGRAAPTSVFEQLDVDHDGYLTEQEGQRSATFKINFKFIDTSGDGRISAEEWADFKRK